MQADYLTAEPKQAFKAATVQLFRLSNGSKKQFKHPGFKNNVKIREVLTSSGICLPPYVTKRLLFLAACSGFPPR